MAANGLNGFDWRAHPGTAPSIDVAAAALPAITILRRVSEHRFLFKLFIPVVLRVIGTFPFVVKRTR